MGIFDTFSGKISLRHVFLSLSLIVPLVLFSTLQFAAQAEPENAAQSGKEIYDGLVPDSLVDIEARIPSLDIVLPAASFPCTSCHGQDGKGGLRASDLRQAKLAQAVAEPDESGRQRAAYTLDDFHRAVVNGVDPSGQILSERMPRFTFNEDQTAALWAYLQLIDVSASPNVNTDGCVGCEGSGQ